MEILDPPPLASYSKIYSLNVASPKRQCHLRPMTGRHSPALVTLYICSTHPVPEELPPTIGLPLSIVIALWLFRIGIDALGYITNLYLVSTQSKSDGE